MSFRKIALVLLTVLECTRPVCAQPHWETIFTPPNTPPFASGGLHSIIYFLDEYGHPEIGFASMGGGTFRTSDTGSTWTRLGTWFPFLDITFRDASTGWTATGMWTTDSGKTWNQLQLPGGDPHGIYYSPATHSVYLSTWTGGGYVSSDEGQHWTSFTQYSELNGYAFVDSLHGILTTTQPGNGLHQTSDGGATWTDEFAPIGCWQPLGRRGTSTFLYVSEYDHSLHRSDDFGTSWRTISTLLDSTTGCLKEDNCGNLYAQQLRGTFVSTNDGVTWSPIGGTATSVDTKFWIQDWKLFSINKNGSILRYSGAGENPSGLSLSDSVLFLRDTVLCGDSLIRFVATTPTGCKPPSISALSIIGADSNNYRIALDNNDSIGIAFQPHRSGQSRSSLLLLLSDGTSRYVALRGYEAGNANTFTFSPHSMFNKDTVACQNSITRKISTSSSGCFPPQVVSASVTGPYASCYSIVSKGLDSFIVEFRSQDVGLEPAQLLLCLSDGQVDTVYLMGAGLANYLLSLESSSQSTDTLGAFVRVPIRIIGLTSSQDVAIVVHYNATRNYTGSFDASGTKLDLPIEQWPGRSKLRIQNVTSGSIAGWAHFTVFADSTAKPTVTFDSVQVLTATSPCEYLPPEPVTATITPPPGCAAPILSRWLRGEPLSLSVLPNPTAGPIAIESKRDLGGAHVEIYDALGTERGSMEISLRAGSPAYVDLPEASGMYYLRIRTTEGSYGSRIVRLK